MLGQADQFGIRRIEPHGKSFECIAMGSSRLGERPLESASLIQRIHVAVKGAAVVAKRAAPVKQKARKIKVAEEQPW